MNSSTDQVVVAGPSPLATDPNQVQGAVLADGASNSLLMHLPAAATTALAVNPVTNMAYFADTAQWYAVSLQSPAPCWWRSFLPVAPPAAIRCAP